MTDRIIQGDCDEQFLKIPSGSIDLCTADPPFNIDYSYDEYNDKRDSEDYLSWCHRWMGQVHRTLKPDGSFWLAIGDEYAAELKVLATRLGFTMRNWVIWNYTFGVSCSHKFARCHTHLLYFTKGKDFTFNADDIRVPSARQLKYNDSRANPLGKVPDDVWQFSRICGTFKERVKWHPCQMPEQILGRIIAACSNPNDVVLDPFMGSGTTAVVSKKLNRRYLGFELSEDYTRKAQERVDAVEFGDPLAGTKFGAAA